MCRSEQPDIGLRHLKRRRRITAMDAFREYSITRLADLRHAAALSAYRTRGADYALYELLKGGLTRHCPDLSPAEYDRAIRAIARLAGV